MARYIRLVKFTREGAQQIAELPKLFRRGSEYLQSMGGRLVEVYAVSGPYDLVAIIDAPSEDVVLKHALFARRTGFVDLCTMSALPVAEFFKLVADVPSD